MLSQLCCEPDKCRFFNIHFTVQSRSAEELMVSQVKAKEFLSAPRRPRRNLWDRSRPDVQQWIQQLMHMGYDEAVSAIKEAINHLNSTD